MKIISFLMAVTLLVSCNIMNPEGISGSGKVTQQTYDVSDFKEIDLSVVFDVEIIPSDTEKVVVETDDNLQNLVLVENDNDSLVIKMKPETSISKRTKGRVTVYVKELNGITNSSVGKLQTNGVLNSRKFVLNNSAVGNTNLKVNTTDLIIKNSAVGNIVLDGSCDGLKIDNSGVGNFEAFNLKSKRLDLNNTAVGNTTVFAIEEMIINNSGVGKLDVYGQGVIKAITNNAVGKFIKH